MSSKKKQAQKNSKKKEDALFPDEKEYKQDTLTLQRHPYLQKIALQDPDDLDRYICTICTRNQKVKGDKGPVGGLTKWLKRHLEEPTHQGYTASSEMSLFNDAIDSLGRNFKRVEAVAVVERL